MTAEHAQGFRRDSVVPFRRVDGTVGFIKVLFDEPGDDELVEGEPPNGFARVRLVINAVVVADPIHDCPRTEHRVVRLAPGIAGFQLKQCQERHGTALVELVAADLEVFEGVQGFTGQLAVVHENNPSVAWSMRSWSRSSSMGSFPASCASWLLFGHGSCLRSVALTWVLPDI